MSDTLEKSDELLTGGDYSAKTFVDKVNNLYPNLKQAGSHTLENQKIFRNLITANWLILPQYTDETKNAEDSDEPIMNWRSRDIPFQYTIFTGFNPNFIDFDNDEDGYQPPTNKAELREFEARYGISCYAYEYHKAKKAGKIDSVENGKPLIFDIKGETITREFVSPNYYDKDTGLNFADDNFGEDDS